MDEYLTKPVKPEELAAALNRLVQTGHEADPVDHTGEAGPSSASEPRDRAPAGSEGAPAAGAPVPVVSSDASPEAGFDFSAALNYVGGDRELLDELLGIFVEDAPIRMKALRHAIGNAEATELTREAHTLKGALKVIGATTAAGLAQGLEALGRDGNLSEADKLAVALEREMDRLMQSLMASKRG